MSSNNCYGVTYHDPCKTDQSILLDSSLTGHTVAYILLPSLVASILTINDDYQVIAIKIWDSFFPCFCLPIFKSWVSNTAMHNVIQTLVDGLKDNILMQALKN